MKIKLATCVVCILLCITTFAQQELAQNNEPEIKSSNESPAPLIQSSETVICQGTTVELNGREGYVNYDWGSDFNNSPQIYVSPEVSTIYYLTVTDEHGNQFSESIYLNVIPEPTVTLSSSKTELKLGQTLKLKASGTDEYMWNVPVESDGSYTPCKAGTKTYIVIGKDTSTGCSSSDTLEVKIRPKKKRKNSELCDCRNQLNPDYLGVYDFKNLDESGQSELISELEALLLKYTEIQL